MGATGAGSSYNLLIATWWLERNHVRLASREPAEAARAWNQLEVSFPSKWWAHDWIGWRVMEDVWRPHDPPIHFPLRREGSRYAASPMPGPADCRTVNEAPMAILHLDPVRKTARAGDWRKWWEANWTYFPNRHLPGKPSGPEDPSRRRRRQLRVRRCRSDREFAAWRGRNCRLATRGRRR